VRPSIRANPPSPHQLLYCNSAGISNVTVGEWFNSAACSENLAANGTALNRGDVDCGPSEAQLTCAGRIDSSRQGDRSSTRKPSRAVKALHDLIVIAGNP